MKHKSPALPFILGAVFLAAFIPAAYFGFQALQPPVRISAELSQAAPLSALAEVKTRRPSRISLQIQGRDDNDLQVDFPETSHHHQIPILGLYPDHQNRVKFRITTDQGQVFERSLTLTTQALPADYPDIRVERQQPDKIAPGLIYLHLGHYDAEGNFTSFPSAIDEYGRVRWLYTGKIGHVFRRLENGNFLIHRKGDEDGRAQGETAGSPDNDHLLEIDPLGRRVALRGEVQTGIHHDAVPMPNGNILTLTSALGSYDDGLVEIAGDSGKVLRGWDLRNILQPERPPQPRNLEKGDWLHLNGIDYNPADDSFILSGRDQSAVVKVQRESGRLKWILGNHEHWSEPFRQYLLQPNPGPGNTAQRSSTAQDNSRQGSSFEWQWGQHAPMFHPDNPRRLLVYDNGNRRSYDKPLPATKNYSRAVEYEVDPSSMEVRQIWEFGRRYGSELYTPFIGDADYLSNGNRLVCFGGITRSLEGEAIEIFDFKNDSINPMKVEAQIIEVTPEQPAQEVLNITIADPDPDSHRAYRSYRAIKMPLYP